MDRVLSSIALICLLAALVLATTSLHGAPRQQAQVASRVLAATEQWQNDRSLLSTIRKQQAEVLAVKAAPKPAVKPVAPLVALQIPVSLPKPAATPKPLPPPPPAPPPSYNSIDTMIKAVFAHLGPGAVAWALRVADCESGDNPHAYNPAGPWMGLFQFAQGTWARWGNGGNVYDAYANASAAARLYAASGPGSWGCS